MLGYVKIHYPDSFIIRDNVTDVISRGDMTIIKDWNDWELEIHNNSIVKIEYIKGER